MRGRLSASNTNRSISQRKSEVELLAVLRPLYSSLGRNPQALVAVTPPHGGWLPQRRNR